MDVAQAHEGMDALVFNLRQEHVVICDFVSTFHQVRSPLAQNLASALCIRCKHTDDAMGRFYGPVLRFACYQSSPAAHASISHAYLGQEFLWSLSRRFPYRLQDCLGKGRSEYRVKPC